jgi:hypothetical protein
MLKRNVTYENFNDETVTETFYFNMTKAELVEFEYAYEGGFTNAIEKMVETNDNKGLIFVFKDLILRSYGIRSEDGKRFIKNEQLCEEFSQTGAYSALFLELATDDKAASEFITGVVPKDMASTVQQELKAQKSTAEIAEEMREINQ